jgi:hypothetical protein
MRRGLCHRIIAPIPASTNTAIFATTITTGTIVSELIAASIPIPRIETIVGATSSRVKTTIERSWKATLTSIETRVEVEICSKKTRTTTVAT